MMHGDSRGWWWCVWRQNQFTSTLSVNFHFPRIPRRTFYGFIGRKGSRADPGFSILPLLVDTLW